MNEVSLISKSEQNMQLLMKPRARLGLLTQRRLVIPAQKQSQCCSLDLLPQTQKVCGTRGEEQRAGRMVLTVYHLGNSRSQSILWLLEEMGIEYNIERFTRTSEGWAPPELEKIHPLGKAPVVRDGDRLLAETGVIIEYLVNKYGPQLGPDKSDEDACLKFSYWLHFAEGSAMPPLLVLLLFKTIDSKAPFFVKPFTKLISGSVNKAYISPNLTKQTAFMESELGKNPQNWFVKGFSAADVMMSFPVISTANNWGLQKYPHLSSWLATIRERPAYKRAMEKAGGEFNM